MIELSPMLGHYCDACDVSIPKGEAQSIELLVVKARRNGGPTHIMVLCKECQYDLCGALVQELHLGGKKHKEETGSG